MAKPTATERLRIARLGVRQAQVNAAGSLWRLPVLRWRYGLPFADRLHIIPKDLRSADPSFLSEVRLGQFGLAGYAADLEGESPFTARPPGRAWARELHGFGWLRHLRAEGSDEARDMARHLVIDWTRHARRKRGIAWEAGTIGARMTSWLCNARLLFEDAPPPVYEAITASLGDQLVELSARWRREASGVARLQALGALVLANLCIKGRDGELAKILPVFSSQLDAQILDDGGHVSRNPAALIELLLDFLPLRQCFRARQMSCPEALEAAITRMTRMACHLRLGDAMIGRFNGMGMTPVDELAKLLSYESGEGGPDHGVGASGYACLHKGSTKVLIDAGPPPALELSGGAHAGCLSFEMSAGGAAIFVNCGFPGSADAHQAMRARATAAHNTLCVNGQSSSKQIDAALLIGGAGGAPLSYPANVTCALDETGGAQTFNGSHDGYLAGFGMIHDRQMRLGGDGLTLTGRDRISGRDASLRLARDLPFAVHFHLHPDVGCDIEPASGRGEGPPEAVLLSLPDGAIWRFAAGGALISLEASTHYAAPGGARGSRQIVLRAASYGESEVTWSLTRVQAGAECGALSAER